MLASVMQALDTTIANVALPHIQGSLSATQDQMAWVLTSYIVAAAIMTPLSGWLAGQFGRKRVFLFSVVGFTVASMLCAASRNRCRRSCWRGCLQGLCGAALSRCRKPCCSISTRRSSHARAMAIWVMGVTMGPDPRSGAGRLADRELQLAMGVLHQRALRDSGLPRLLEPHAGDGDAQVAFRFLRLHRA